MKAYVALVRAVNVGGTGLLKMSDLKAVGEACGLARVRTYLASGNLLFESALDEGEIKLALEAGLRRHAGKPVAAFVRSAAELARVVADNPFPEAPGNRVTATFLDSPPPRDAAEQARNLAGERIALGVREIFVCYDEGMARSRLVIPAAKAGTARNMNTVTKLADLSCL